MALQINFKWNIPLIKYILKWHVEAGSGLAITGIFHFIWHLSYFGNIFSKTGNYKTSRIAGFDSSVIIIQSVFPGVYQYIGPDIADEGDNEYFRRI